MRFDVHPTDLRFILFGPTHLVALGIIVAVGAALVLLRRRLDERARRWVRYGLAGLMLGSKLWQYLWMASNRIFDPREDLPLHLCTVISFVTVVMLLTRNRFLYELVYFLGLGGATQALLTPEIGALGYPHLYFFVSFIMHGGIDIAAIYMTVVEGFRPSWRGLWRVTGTMALYMAAMLALNARLGSNYLWVSRKPDFPSLIDMLGPWPWYDLSLIGVGIATLLVLYLPFAVMDWRRGRVGRGERTRAARA